MRSIVCAALALILAAGGRSAHADEPRRQNTVTTNPARFGILHFQVEYERVVANRWSAFVAPIGFFHATWYPFAHAHGVTAWGAGVDVGTRWYLFGASLDGAYVGPLFSLYRGEVSYEGNPTLSGYVFSTGAQGGYSWLLDRWVLAAGLGLSYGFASKEAPDDSPRAAQLPHWGPWVNFRLNAGIAF
jgi:hypothetical protein